jgi:UDP-N-acetylmuramoyl-tripeptide--D-alanyl-D-alanine ligase
VTGDALLDARVAYRRRKRKLRLATAPLVARLATVHRRTVARRVRLIAVSGSYGKSTTARAIAATLGISPERAPIQRNFGPLLHGAMLRTAPWARWAVFEVGLQRPGQMRRNAAPLRPDMVVITAVGDAHLGAFRDPEHLRNQKAELVRALAADGTAFLNGDDERVRSMAAETAARWVTFGLGEGNEVRGCDVRMEWPHGTGLTVHTRGELFPVRLRLLGSHNAYAALAAFAVALHEGREPAVIARALEGLRPMAGRMELVEAPAGVRVIDDSFNSDWRSMVAGMETLAEVPAGRKVIVMGGVTGAPRPARRYSRTVGTQAGRIADRLIVVGGEFRRAYRGGLNDSGIAREKVSYVRTPTEAAELLRGELGPGDVVLVQGRPEQQMSRAVLALEGHPVRCGYEQCPIHDVQGCESCPLLGRATP